jgi:hypothetical protein
MRMDIHPKCNTFSSHSNHEMATLALLGECNKGVIGDEFHYLLNCPRFNEQRISYLRNYYCHHPNVLKLNDIMTKADYQVIRKLAMFCNAIQKKIAD